MGDGLKCGRPTTLRSRGQSRFVSQHQQFVTAQFRERDGSPIRIEKLHLERIRRVNFDNRPNLSGNKSFFRLVLKESNDI